MINTINYAIFRTPLILTMATGEASSIHHHGNQTNMGKIERSSFHHVEASNNNNNLI